MHRKQLVLNLGVVLLTTATWTLAQPPSAAARNPNAKPAAPADTQGKLPRIEITSREFDFGEVWEGTPASKDFTIRNVGEAPLTISARSTCGCTVATKPKSPLEPGESTKFSVTYDTKRAGRARKKVILTTNDPKDTRVEVLVSGVVKALFDADPSNRMAFGNLAPDAHEERVVKLVNKYPKPVKLSLSKDATHDGFDVRLKEIEAGQKYEVIVQTKPPLKSGRTATNIKLETDVDDMPPLTLMAYAYVPPAVSVAPPRLYIPANIKSGDSRQLHVRYRPEDNVKLTEVHAEPETIKAEIVDIPDGSSPSKGVYRIRLEFPDANELPPHSKLLITTNHKSPEYQHLEVPLIKRVATRRAGQNFPPRGKRAAVKPQPAKPDKPDSGGMSDAEIRKMIMKAIEAKKNAENQEKADEAKSKDNENAEKKKAE